MEPPPPDDPFEAAVAVIAGNVAVDPVLRDFDLLVVAREPWLLFVDRSAGAERAARIGEEIADLLDSLHREVFARLGAELGLRPLRDFGPADMRVLRVLVFTTREAADRYDRTVRSGRPYGAVADYGFGDRWLTAWASSGTLSEYQAFSILSMGFHQLMHVFRKAALESGLGAEVTWTDPRLGPGLLALEDGMAGLFAGISQDPRGGSETSAPCEAYRELLRNRKACGAPCWDLPDLLSVRSERDLARQAARRQSGLRLVEEDAFRATAVAFCRFLWFSGDGKYRPKTVEYLRGALIGRSGPEEFRSVFGWTATGDGFAAAEAEWQAYRDAMLREEKGD